MVIEVYGRMLSARRARDEPVDTHQCYNLRIVSYISVQGRGGIDRLTLTVVNTTAARVPKVGVATQIMETTRTAAEAVSFIAH